MSSVFITEGQFYKEVTEGAPARGWTIKKVECGPIDSPTKKHGLAWVWVIRNDVRTSVPIRLSYAEVEEWIHEAQWNPVNGPLRPTVEIDDLPKEEQVKILAVEAEKLKLIQPVLDLGAAAFWQHVRRPLMAKIAEANDRSIDYIWQLVCAHWQHAGSHGLRPRAKLAGQKSLVERVQAAERLAQADTEGRTNPGDHFRAYKTGRKPGPGVAEGKTMELADIRRCRLGAKKFLFKPSADGSLRLNFDYAYTETLREYYDWNETGKEHLPIPSLDQFELAVRTDPEFDKLSVRIVGKATAVRSRRPMKETTRDEVLGPGVYLQIDDVKTKVKLACPYTRLPIGDARAFVGIDTWSKCIAGSHETLGGSDFEGVKELIVNVALPKAAFFEKHKLKVDPEQFPITGIYRYIAADKGPLGGALGNILPKDFCDLSNMAAYRPDLKADIESAFHAYLVQIATTLPGYTRVDPRTGQPYPDTVACLTLAEFRQIFWAWIAQYNTRVLNSYLPEEALRFLEDERPVNSPAILARWGMNHLTGHLPTKPENVVRRKLLRKHKGTLSGRRGILFKKLHYFIDGDVQYRFKSEPVEIGYSDNYALQIYVWLNGECLTASLHGEEATKFGHLSFPEIEREKRYRERQEGAARSNHRRAKVNTSRTRAGVVAGAQQGVEEAFPDKVLHRVLRNGTSAAANRIRGRKDETAAATLADSKAFPPRAVEPATPAPTPPQKLSMRALRKKDMTFVSTP